MGESNPRKAESWSSPFWFVVHVNHLLVAASCVRGSLSVFAPCACSRCCFRLSCRYWQRAPPLDRRTEHPQNGKIVVDFVAHFVNLPGIALALLLPCGGSSVLFVHGSRSCFWLKGGRCAKMHWNRDASSSRSRSGGRRRKRSRSRPPPGYVRAGLLRHSCDSGGFSAVPSALAPGFARFVHSWLSWLRFWWLFGRSARFVPSWLGLLTSSASDDGSGAASQGGRERGCDGEGEGGGAASVQSGAPGGGGRWASSVR